MTNKEEEVVVEEAETETEPTCVLDYDRRTSK
jgi:hypothetical protein